MPTEQERTAAEAAILAMHPTAWSIAYHGSNDWSAKVGHLIAYFVIVNGKVEGDVWYE